METRKKPLLIYDGDCGFCRRWVNRWKRVTSRRVDYAPFQEVAEQFPEISKEEFLSSVQLVEPGGKVSRGAEAVFRTLAHTPGWGWPLWLYKYLPGFAPLAQWRYRTVAKHRARGSDPAAAGGAGTTRSSPGAAACAVEQTIPPTYQLTRSIFLRGLGLIYLIAFASLWTQVTGLIGENGILPVGELLQSAKERFGSQAFSLLPTLCWFGTSDAFLHFLCGGGVLLSVLLIFAVAPVPLLAILWVFYLSLTVVSQQFLSFQWDALLLETGFLAIFLAPWTLKLRSKESSPPSRLILWLMTWLLFRLTFSSGAVKLTSGDLTWRDLTALTFHYETQPLPTWIGWWFHQAPVWFQKLSCFLMFGIELIIPFLIFGPRTVRLIGCAILVAFQLLIVATGNYCFFNLLTILLCLLLLDDRVWSRWFKASPAGATQAQSPAGSKRSRERLRLSKAAPLGFSGGTWPRWILVPVAALLLGLSTFHLAGLSQAPFRIPKPLIDGIRFLAPFRVVNGYGLFAVMTTSRPEIVVEGSRDGKRWIPYEFKYKPQEPKRRPGFNIPHQPRLDWQMWFAALGTYQQNPWFIRFCAKLLEGSGPVLELLERNPFPESPPQYIRATVYEYHFTDWETRRSYGTWWRRSLKGLYSPVLSLKEEKARGN